MKSNVVCLNLVIMETKVFVIGNIAFMSAAMILTIKEEGGYGFKGFK